MRVIKKRMNAPASRRALPFLGAISALATAIVLIANMSALAHVPTDPLHGGTGVGAKVIGHSDLGGGGLNGNVAVLGNTAFVGQGTNGGFAAQWNKTPTCKAGGGPTSNVKVVDLTSPASPTLISTIPIGSGAQRRLTLARDVAAIHVSTPAFTGDVLAVGLERCNNDTGGDSGVEFYDVTDPAAPKLLSKDLRNMGQAFNTATRQVTLVSRPSDGRVFALEANNGVDPDDSGIQVLDITDPKHPQQVGTFPQGQFPSVDTSRIQECRPFNFAQGVSSNAAGTTAYAAFYDKGLFRLDISNPTGTLPALSQTQYPVSEEGNSFRFVPNDSETTALATDEDLNPAKTSLTVTSGSASQFTEPGGTGPGVFRGCEAIWGAGAPNTGPLYRRTAPSVTSQVVFAPNGGCDPSDFAAVDSTGKIVLVFRGGTLASGDICGFEDKARFAQQDGAAALLVGNSAADHHGGASGFLFSVDSVSPADAGITLPVVLITREARDAIRNSQIAGDTVTATLADSPDTWGALRIVNLAGGSPIQVGVFNAPHTTVLTPGDGLYHAVNPLWAGNQAVVAWMSDGLRVVDAGTPAAPKGRAFYVPPA
ncbi:MAG: PA domain-containing protein, partial [Actinomycetota bacterium]